VVAKTVEAKSFFNFFTTIEEVNIESQDEAEIAKQ
jgi:hypothetical protein